MESMKSYKQSKSFHFNKYIQAINKSTYKYYNENQNTTTNQERRPTKEELCPLHPSRPVQNTVETQERVHLKNIQLARKRTIEWRQQLSGPGTARYRQEYAR